MCYSLTQSDDKVYVLDIIRTEVLIELDSDVFPHELGLLSEVINDSMMLSVSIR